MLSQDGNGLVQLLGGASDILDLFRRFVLLTEQLERPKSVRFVVIKHRNVKTGKWIDMPQSLVNDEISNIPLEFDNLAGQKVNPPSGGTVTIALVDSTGAASTAATAVLGADGSSVDVTPTPADGTNLAEFTIQFSDQANVDLTASLDCVFTNDPNAASTHFVTQNITTRPVGP